MADDGADIGYCGYCARPCEVKYVNGVPYCRDHVPLVLRQSDLDMIFEKAGQPVEDTRLFTSLFRSKW